MKTKLFISLIALAALALIFSACSSDSEDSGSAGIGSCYVDDGPGGAICYKIDKGLSESYGKSFCEKDNDGKWKAKGSCPGKPELECPVEADEWGFDGVIYLYGAWGYQTGGCFNL